MKLGLGSLLAVALIAMSAGAAAASEDGLLLRGFGTPVVDGTLSPGEWDSAGRYEFAATRAASEGGGTVPATMYVMNDGVNLYLALRVTVTNLGYSAFDAVFPASPQNTFGPGNDVLRASPSSFEDLHFHLVPPNNYPWVADVDDGGTRDGAAVVRTNGESSVFEVSHPLDSADDRHDFSLGVARRVRLAAAFHHCPDSCVTTLMPSSGFGEIVVVSGTHVPPDTTITRGPRNGAEVRGQPIFDFTGSDDVVSPNDLTFECSVDADEWSSCESPLAGVIEDGWHTLRIRALDDMLNVDPTPAARRWRIDTKAPSRPSVRAPRPATRGTVYRFSSTDRGTSSHRLRFRCAIDTRRLHSCASRYRLQLPPGRHVLRVRAVDPAGNESGTTTVRLVVRLRQSALGR